MTIPELGNAIAGLSIIEAQELLRYFKGRGQCPGLSVVYPLLSVAAAFPQWPATSHLLSKAFGSRKPTVYVSASALNWFDAMSEGWKAPNKWAQQAAKFYP